MHRISESDLILPALYLLHQHGPLGTSDLIALLRELLQPSGEDLDILSGRNDDKFSQKVRNLKAHKTLTKKRLVTENIIDGSTKFDLTTVGKEVYIKNMPNIKALLPFPLADTKDIYNQILNSEAEVIVLNENEIIMEAKISERNVAIRSRSQKLRDTAIEHYTQEGRIRCLACKFEFYRAYGETGKNYIEIHHLKPIYELSPETKINISEALGNVAPLCANCHRIVHRRKPPYAISELKEIIQLDYLTFAKSSM